MWRLPVLTRPVALSKAPSCPGPPSSLGVAAVSGTLLSKGASIFPGLSCHCPVSGAGPAALLARWARCSARRAGVPPPARQLLHPAHLGDSCEQAEAIEMAPPPQDVSPRKPPTWKRLFSSLQAAPSAGHSSSNRYQTNCQGPLLPTAPTPLTLSSARLSLCYPSRGLGPEEATDSAPTPKLHSCSFLTETAWVFMGLFYVKSWRIFGETPACKKEKKKPLETVGWRGAELEGLGVEPQPVPLCSTTGGLALSSASHGLCAWQSLHLPACATHHQGQPLVKTVMAVAHRP